MSRLFPRQSGALKTATLPAGILFRSGSKHKCQKRSRPKGRLQFGRWFVGLEEDHAANLEQIEILVARAKVRPVLGFPVWSACNVVACRTDVERKVLPPGEEVHCGGVDFLHQAHTPAIDRK